ncbi:UNKNOWN [Stylonychia lemnae]|uniref:Uncharacterized protein n=1 Tax=Stylonychia lemnae TaxID=5949 RepID=A0A078B4M1_STYLE|nr:UNKNOWN [Stylonychia lemnae]|eukprot:CDW89480.1 UNKNOWN [Stylonychia lemnae]
MQNEIQLIKDIVNESDSVDQLAIQSQTSQDQAQLIKLDQQLQNLLNTKTNQEFFPALSEMQMLGGSYSKLSFKRKILKSSILNELQNSSDQILVFNIIYNLLNPDEIYSTNRVYIHMIEAERDQSKIDSQETDVLIYLIFKKESKNCPTLNQSQKIKHQLFVTQKEIESRYTYSKQKIEEAKLLQNLTGAVGEIFKRRLEFKLAESQIQSEINQVDFQLSEVITKEQVLVRQCLENYEEYLKVVGEQEYFSNNMSNLDISQLDESNPVYEFQKDRNIIKLDAALKNLINFLRSSPPKLLDDQTRTSLYYLEDRRMIKFANKLSVQSQQERSF